MGEEIAKSHFSPSDFEEFMRRLREETEGLRRLFREGRLEEADRKVGYELETWLIDAKGRPNAINEEFLSCLKSPRVVPELSRFNVELNSLPYEMDPHFLSRLQQDLEAKWKQCQRCAHALSGEMLMIGILPTLKERQLTLENMSPLERFRALNEQCLRLREGKPFRLDIQGRDHMVTSHEDVMLEAATTSLQIHLQVLPRASARFYNASLLLSAPMVALAANSPYLFGYDLWDETRIALFEQAVAVGGSRDEGSAKRGRVTFGSGYASESVMECFEENLEKYPVILPLLFKEKGVRHLHLHNGTIWRWNRPIVDVGESGVPHLRIEHRVMAAGPSLPDMVAHIAVFVGLAYRLAFDERAPEENFPFEKARRNFYAAAQKGLGAEVEWLNGKTGTVQALFLEELLPLAKEGLRSLGVHAQEIRFYLEEVLQKRVESGQNGAVWQRRFVARHGRDFEKLTQAYAARQKGGAPVHEWSV